MDGNTDGARHRHVTTYVEEEVSNSSRTDLLLLLGSFRAFTIQESAQTFQLFLLKSHDFYYRTQNVTKELPFLCTPVCKRQQWLKRNITFVCSVLTAALYLCRAQNFATEFITEEGHLLSLPNLFRLNLDSYAK